MLGVYEPIKERLKEVLNKYPDVQIGIENTMLVHTFKEKIRGNETYGEGVVELANELRKYLETDRIGTVLDTCHIISTLKLLKVIDIMGSDFKRGIF